MNSFPGISKDSTKNYDCMKHNSVCYVSMYTIKVLIPLSTIWKHVYSLLHLIILSQNLLKKYFLARFAKLLIMMMMMMMMMMSCFCGMVDRRKAFSLIFSRDHCYRSSLSRISDTLLVEFEPSKNLNSGFAKWSRAVVITTSYTTAPIFSH